MRQFFFAAVTACVTLAAASDATAQLFPLFPQVRANIQANRAARNQTPIATQQGVVQTTPNGYGVGQSGDGWVAPVISIGRASGTLVEGSPNNPYQVPQAFADQTTDRIRVVTSDGQFYVSNYDANGDWIGSNWNMSGLQGEDRYESQNRRWWNRKRWGDATGTTRRIGDGFQPLLSGERSVPQYSSGGTSRNSSASTSARNMQMFNSIMANSNAQIQAINNRSSAFRSSSNAATSNLGASLRSSMSGSSGGGGTKSIVFDDNAPGKKR